MDVMKIFRRASVGHDGPCGCILPGDLHDAIHGGEPGGRVICSNCGASYKLWEFPEGHCLVPEDPTTHVDPPMISMSEQALRRVIFLAEREADRLERHWDGGDYCYADHQLAVALLDLVDSFKSSLDDIS